MKKGSVTKNTSRKNKLSLVITFLKGSKMFFLLSILFTFLTSLADMVIPQIVRFVIDCLIGGEKPQFNKIILNIINMAGGTEYLKNNMWIMAISVIFFALIKVGCSFLLNFYNAKGAETLSENTRNQLYIHIANLPYSWHKQNKTGDIIQRCTSDVETLNDFLSQELTYFTHMVTMIILSVVFMMRMNVILTIIAISAFPVIILTSILFDKRVEEDFSAYDKQESIVSTIVQENLTGARVVRAFGQEKKEYDKFLMQNQHFTELGERAGKTYSWFSGVSSVLLAIQVMLVIVFGAVFAVKGQMTTGEYIAFIAYNAMLAWPLSQLGVTITELGKSNIALSRIFNIMEAEEEKDSILNKGTKKPDLRGDIVFNNVSFAYDDSNEILKNITFNMKGGTTLGVLGGTGSGKTTLVMLLDKIYSLKPENGNITIGGVDINDINSGYLRKNIGISLQDPYLFSDTIINNIAITKDEIDRNAIDEVVKSACLEETINNFNKGYETFVGERGVTLSGGQKQRISIARILMGKCPILIFDDSLSAVDTETDNKIRKAIEKKFGSCSIIIISHRITTLSKADKIIVLSEGKIVDSGTHKELLTRDGLYRDIYNIQQGEDDGNEEK